MVTPLPQPMEIRRRSGVEPELAASRDVCCGAGRGRRRPVRDADVQPGRPGRVRRNRRNSPLRGLGGELAGTPAATSGPRPRPRATPRLWARACAPACVSVCVCASVRARVGAPGCAGAGGQDTVGPRQRSCRGGSGGRAGRGPPRAGRVAPAERPYRRLPARSRVVARSFLRGSEDGRNRWT